MQCPFCKATIYLFEEKPWEYPIIARLPFEVYFSTKKIKGLKLVEELKNTLTLKELSKVVKLIAKEIEK